MRWIVGHHVGSSSRAIWAHMMDAGEPDWGWSHPHDPADLFRCLRLLDFIPEWKVRLPEMAARSESWAALVGRWDEIVASFDSEFGAEPHRRGTGKTYDLMRNVIDGARAA